VDHPVPTFWTVAQYNEWHYFQHFPNATTPPLRFPAVGRFIGSSDNADEWAGGISALLRTGFTGVALPATKPLGTLLQSQQRLAPSTTALDTQSPPSKPLWAAGIYAPPGGPFDFDCGVTEADVAWVLDDWANKTATSYAAAGFDLNTSTTFALADEPGWCVRLNTISHHHCFLLFALQDLRLQLEAVVVVVGRGSR